MLEANYAYKMLRKLLFHVEGNNNQLFFKPKSLTVVILFLSNHQWM